ncbi:MAG: peptide deformylase [Candidatus Dojkabacteria bacterium]|nr:MAG: peptide deformylase [Candidatus Dojkabacteria bacterium]
MLDLRFIGDPILYKKTPELTKKDLASAKIQVFAKDLLDTVTKLPAAGLAAPQVGKNYRMFCIILEKDDLTYKLESSSNKKAQMPLILPDKPFLFVNPQVEKLGNEVEYSEEACLSIPYYYGIVERYTKVKVSFMDLKGDKYVITATGFMARVLQHEFDHLNGVLWTQRITSPKDIHFQTPDADEKGF